jgi:hypothetical protein
MKHTVIYTLGKKRSSNEFVQGSYDGGVYVDSTQDGNFSLFHAMTSLKMGLELPQERFGKIFGRVPVRGLKMRADVFLRLCVLGGLKPGLLHSDPKVLTLPGEEKVYLFTCEEGISPTDPVFALQYQPDGNLRLTNEFRYQDITGGVGVSFDQFEGMFGLEPRDFFANEVLRIAGLVGIHIGVTDA